MKRRKILLKHLKEKDNYLLLECKKGNNYFSLSLSRIFPRQEKVFQIYGNTDFCYIARETLSSCQKFKKKQVLKEIIETDKERELKKKCEMFLPELKKYKIVKKSILFPERRGQKYFYISSAKKDYLIPVGTPHRLDFMFPGFSLFKKTKKGRDVFVLRDVCVPYTHFEVDYESRELTDVFWVIPCSDDNGTYVIANYPFNTARGPCSPLKTSIREGKNPTALLWYSEMPNTDLPSIRVELLPLMLLLLKEGRFELLPLTYRQDCEVILTEKNERKKHFNPKIKFEVVVKVVNGKKQEDIREFCGKITETYLPGKYIDAINTKLPREIRGEVTVERL